MYKNILIKITQEKKFFLYSLLFIFFLYLYLTDHELLTTSMFLFSLFQAPQGKTIDELKNDEYQNYQDKYRENLKQEIDERKLNSNNKTQDVENEFIPNKKVKQTTKFSQATGSIKQTTSKMITRQKIISRLRVSIYYLGILYFLQFMIAAVSVAALGMIGAVDSIPLIGSAVVSAVDWLFQRVTGVEFTEIFIIFLILAAIIGWVQVGFLLLIFFLSGAKSLSGQYIELKWILFIFTMTLYLFPLVNFFPIAIAWLLIVFLFPK